MHRRTLTARRAITSTLCLAGSLLATGGLPASAQTAFAQTPNLALSFSGTTSSLSTAFAKAGDTVTVYVYLNDSSTDGTGLSIYDTNFGISTASLNFVNFNSGTPFLETSAAFSQSQSTNTASATAATSVLREGYGNTSTSGYTNHGSMLLGQFQVSVLALSAGGTTLTIGAASNPNADNFGSELVDVGGHEVLQSVSNATLLPLPASAPEPSQWAAFGIGLLGLGALTIKARAGRARG